MRTDCVESGSPYDRVTVWMGSVFPPGQRTRGRRQQDQPTPARAVRTRGNPIVSCPGEADQHEERLVEIRVLEAQASATEPVLFADDVDITLNPKIGRAWMLKGTQRWILNDAEHSIRNLQTTSSLFVTSAIIDLALEQLRQFVPGR
jgi:hypothetical protein